MDGMGGPLDGIIDSGEVEAGYNKGALKIEVLATPSPTDPMDVAGPPAINRDLWFGDFLRRCHQRL